MAFDPINTQEELDKVIQSRIERERKAIESRYSDYDALKLQVADLTQKLNRFFAYKRKMPLIFFVNYFLSATQHRFCGS